VQVGVRTGKEKARPPKKLLKEKIGLKGGGSKKNRGKKVRRKKARAGGVLKGGGGSGGKKVFPIRKRQGREKGESPAHRRFGPTRKEPRERPFVVAKQKKTRKRRAEEKSSRNPTERGHDPFMEGKEEGQEKKKGCHHQNLVKTKKSYNYTATKRRSPSPEVKKRKKGLHRKKRPTAILP